MKLTPMETGQKYMAQTTNISNLNINQELSIQVSLSGLSFCILHKDSNTITYIKHIAFENKVNPIELLDKLKHAFNSEDVLNETFSAVNVVHVNDLSSLVPKPLFNEDYLADYLKFNSKILKSDFIIYMPEKSKIFVGIKFGQLSLFKKFFGKMSKICVRRKSIYAQEV